MTYEGMASMNPPMINKNIPGPALSWTLPADQQLKPGGRYTWFVQALDAYEKKGTGKYPHPWDEILY
jgi:hypothetical protein